jgi:hypothetical protein
VIALRNAGSDCQLTSDWMSKVSRRAGLVGIARLTVLWGCGWLTRIESHGFLIPSTIISNYFHFDTRKIPAPHPIQLHASFQKARKIKGFLEIAGMKHGFDSRIPLLIFSGLRR